MQQEDVRLDEGQKAMIDQMLKMDNGIADEYEAKLRVLNIAAPPDHFKRIVTGYKAYPKMLYNSQKPEWKPCPNAEEHEKAKEAGWLDEPQKMHLDKLQTPNSKITLSFCTKCDKDISGMKFCPECGTSAEINVGPLAMSARKQRHAKESAKA